jgi:iron complex transport system ATP-binding protein
MEAVSFSYPGRKVLHEIDLKITPRSFVALIGPNGSGKTTLLRLMSKVLKPQGGRVLLQGQPLSSFRARALARRVAVISSEQSFEFPFAVRDVVSMGRFPHLNRFQRMSENDWDIVGRALKMTSADALEDRPISQLSSGEKQRVLIARAIAQEPQVLILDEPNAHLDINHQIAIFNLLRSLNRDLQMTIVVVLHDLTCAAAFCEIVVLIHKGRIVRVGRPAEVITAELIRQTYGAKVQVFASPAGGYPQVAFGPDSGSES